MYPRLALADLKLYPEIVFLNYDSKEYSHYFVEVNQPPDLHSKYYSETAVILYCQVTGLMYEQSCCVAENCMVRNSHCFEIKRVDREQIHRH